MYAGIALTSDEIWEEVICDFLGDINIFAKSPNGYLVVKELIEQTQAIVKEQMAESNQTRGSPTTQSKATSSAAKKLISYLNKGYNAESNDIRYSREIDSDGKSYWQIETDKDVFANLTNIKDLQKAAYKFILHGDKGSKIVDIIDGERLEFIRISASEYVYGSDSTKLTQEEYKQKMRMSTSIIDLIENAPITYDAPDHKKHKLFPDGFKNYQGRVGIDDTIFKYIVRVGKAKNGKIFYDICLEVDGKVPRAKRTSLIKSSTSTNSIPQNDDLSTQNSKNNFEGKASRELDAEYLSAVERGDMETAQKMVDEAAKKAGYTVRAYHGTARGDRVGNVFLPERATSGPMAFFTDNKDIADHYARDKSDTSLAYDTEYDSYYTQFRVNHNGKSISIPELWYKLSFSEKSKIMQRAQHITFDENSENIVYDSNAKYGLGGLDSYRINSNKGNYLRALVEEWLEDGNLYNEEQRFLDVLKLVGIENVEYRDPQMRYEKTYDTWLKIQNPFDTDSVNQSFYDGLSEWIEDNDMTLYERESSNADLWDKNSQTPESWLDKLYRDIENDTTHAWTVIPDFVTDYLKTQGYDGIKDKGGKNGGAGHTVWIPFSSDQIKSAEAVTYDDDGNVIPLSERFNAESKDIRYSREPFSKQVDNVLNGADTNSTHLKVMDTPSLLQDAGLPDLPILITAKHLKTITQAKGKDRANYHGLDVEIIKNLPQYISNPVMIADSLTRDDSVVIITEALDKQNRPVIAAIMLNGKGRLDGGHIDANIMTSAYGKDHFQNFINNIAKENAVIYWHKNKSQKLSVSLGIQFPNAITRLDSDTIIRQSNAFVNTNSKNNFEGKASRELDAEYLSAVERGDMLTAQRMVDEAAKNWGAVTNDKGKVTKFYHGTKAKFNEFKEARSNGWLGKGIYFTDNKKYAKQYGKKVLSVYLNSDKVYVSKENDHFNVFSELQQKYPQINDFNITKGLKEAGYKGIMYLDWDTDRGLIVSVFSPEQIKSADPVTYDDDGNVIPLSERFNAESKDIRYSREIDVLDYITPEGELEGVDEMGFSNRELLASALLDTVTGSEEYKLIRSYQEEIAGLDKSDKRLQKNTDQKFIYQFQFSNKERKKENERIKNRIYMLGVRLHISKMAWKMQSVRCVELTC